MTDYYSTMAVHGCIPCSDTDFIFLELAFIAEMERFEEEGLGFCLEAEYQDGKAFIYAEHYFDNEWLYTRCMQRYWLVVEDLRSAIFRVWIFADGV